MRDIVALPQELTRLLFELGNRILVLVEGDSDRYVFREWFHEELARMEFFAAGGELSLEEYLTTVLVDSSHKRVYGIADRDFRDDAAVENALNDPGAHLFFLRRYCIENYLLEPPAVFEQLRLWEGDGFQIANAAEMEHALLTLCRRLSTMMAAKWVLHEAGAEPFSEGHDLSGRASLLKETAKRLAVSVEEATTLVAAKEKLIEASLTNLNAAYARTNGKRVLQHVLAGNCTPIKSGLRRDHFRRLLANSVKRNLGVHADLRAIVLDRILNRQ